MKVHFIGPIRVTRPINLLFRRELKKQGLIADVRDKVELAAEVLKFFGVATPAKFSAVWSGIQSEWARERKEIGKGEFGVYATRRRMGELER